MELRVSSCHFEARPIAPVHRAIVQFRSSRPAPAPHISSRISSAPATTVPDLEPASWMNPKANAGASIEGAVQNRETASRIPRPFNIKVIGVRAISREALPPHRENPSHTSGEERPQRRKIGWSPIWLEDRVERQASSTIMPTMCKSNCRRC